MARQDRERGEEVVADARVNGRGDLHGLNRQAVGFADAGDLLGLPPLELGDELVRRAIARRHATPDIVFGLESPGLVPRPFHSSHPITIARDTAPARATPIAPRPPPAGSHAAATIAADVRFRWATHSPGDHRSGAGRRLHADEAAPSPQLGAAGTSAESEFAARAPRVARA